MSIPCVTMALALVVVTPVTGAAQTPAERGLEVVREMDGRNRGYRDFESRLVMTIYDGGDRSRTREMVVRGLESDDGDRTMVVLERPADLAVTAFLTVQGRGGDRAQWIYLPSQRRARRIGGSQSSDRFLGSHFTYADLAPPSVEGFDYRWVRDGDVGGIPCAVVERTPTTGDPRLPVRSLLWIDSEGYRLHRVDHLDESGSVARTLLILDYTVIDSFSRPARMEMQQARSDKRTVLEWSEVRLGVGLSESDFDPSRLGR